MYSMSNNLLMSLSIHSLERFLHFLHIVFSLSENRWREKNNSCKKHISKQKQILQRRPQLMYEGEGQDGVGVRQTRAVSAFWASCRIMLSLNAASGLA